MSQTPLSPTLKAYPHWRDVLQLLKPITWFPPMWAFGCGVASAGVILSDKWFFVLGGILLAGPLVCVASQAVNDWFDRHVDAINEPDRPIPSGRIPGRWGLYLGIIWSAASLVLGAALGLWAFIATIVAVALAWAYSAPPFRFKADGWVGPAVVGISYEGVAWFTGAAVVLGGLPGPLIVAAAFLYSVGAHGIMTLNDFKAIEGDTKLGVRSLPVQLGPERAALVARAVMLLAQIVVIAGLFIFGAMIHGVIVTVLVAVQVWLMSILFKDPEGKAPWYNATGVTLYVLGMLVTALAIGQMGGGPSWG